MAELRIVNQDGGKNLVVFVHGIRDDGEGTFKHPEAEKSWGEMLVEDSRFSSLDVATFHYSSQLFQGDRLSISNVADQLIFRLDSRFLEQYANIVFVAHSMGGLVVRDALLKNAQLAAKVPLVYFLATPTTGSHIAKIGTSIGIRNRQLRALTSFERSNFLESLNSRWRTSPISSQIYSLCAVETKPTKGVIVVDSASAQALCDGLPVPSGETHSDIAKPVGPDSLVAKVFADRLHDTITAPQAKHMALVSGYDSARAQAFSNQGKDFSDLKRSIDLHLQQLGVSGLYYPNELGDGEIVAQFVNAVTPQLREIDKKLESAFLLGFAGLVETNTPGMFPEFSVDLAASSAGFEPRANESQSQSSYLEALVSKSRWLLGTDS